jgi:hypothetical protein
MVHLATIVLCKALAISHLDTALQEMKQTDISAPCQSR